MSSTRFRMIGVGLFVVALSALEAIQWDGSPADKASITACVGDITSIPWSFVKGDGDTNLHLTWSFQAPGSGKEKTAIATWQNGHFHTTDKKKFGFLPNAGLSLHDARAQDSGNYSVKVQLLQANSSVAFVVRTVTLSVANTPPATRDGDLHVTLCDAVRNDAIEVWTVPLNCGHFVDLGHPAVGVVWTTPSGEVRNSKYEDKGTFVLPLSGTVQGGNYSCHLSPSAPAVRCLPATSSLKATAQLYVDGKDFRLSLQDAQLQEMKAQQQETKTRQSKLIGDQAAQIQNLNRNFDFMFKRLMSSCQDWLAVDPRSGVRAIQASGQSIAVYCDQATDNGGWTVFQRRKDASVDFYRNWTEYRNGFGDLEGNLWLGLDKLHSLTTSQKFEMRVDLRTGTFIPAHATYSGFYVDDASLNFTLHFDNFTGGSAGDSLSYHRGRQFTTKDRDHDTRGSANCAQQFHGAWWYKECYQSNLNANYKTYKFDRNSDGLIWKTFGSYSYSFVEMKIRPM